MKTLRGNSFIHKFDRKLRAKQTPTHLSRQLDGILINLSVTKKNRIFMCEQDYENKKIGDKHNFQFFANTKLKFSS